MSLLVINISSESFLLKFLKVNFQSDPTIQAQFPLLSYPCGWFLFSFPPLNTELQKILDIFLIQPPYKWRSKKDAEK
jgi:hypothetical protein